MEEETSQKRSVFWYGVIGFGIIFTCVLIVKKILEANYTLWKEVGLEWILKNYVWKHISIPWDFIDIETKINYIILLLPTLLFIYILGWMFSIHKSGVVIEKTVIRIPLINTVFAKAKEMFELVHNIKNGSFVMLQDYLNEGSEIIGVATKKQIFEKDGIPYAKPCVLILTSFFLPNGTTIFPEQEKVLRIKTSSSKVFTFLVMFGFAALDKEKDKDKFEIEGMEEESRKTFIEKYYTV